MVHIEDVTDSPDGAGGGSVDGVRRRVHFSNEVMSRDADNNEVEGSGSGDAQAEVCHTVTKLTLNTIDCLNYNFKLFSSSQSRQPNFYFGNGKVYMLYISG